MPSPTTHSLREVLVSHVAPVLKVCVICSSILICVSLFKATIQLAPAPGPDPDALVIYLRAGDIFDPTVDHVNPDYVQAPCSYFHKVIHDSGLHKVRRAHVYPSATTSVSASTDSGCDGPLSVRKLAAPLS